MTYLVNTFCPGFNGVHKIALGNWDMLGKSCSTRKIHSVGFKMSHRRPKSLRDLLVKAKLDPEEPLAPRPNKNRCLSWPKCNYCPQLNKSGRIKCTVTGREYTSKYNVCCSSTNLIYCITCKICGIQYVGQTEKAIKTRFSDHHGKISRMDFKRSEVSRHMNSCSKRGRDSKHRGLTFAIAIALHISL